jgi:hypothetical protein
MFRARDCVDFDQMLDMARTEAHGFEPPLPDDEVAKVARSAWRYTAEGRNWFGVGRGLVIPYAAIDDLMMQNPDAFLILSRLRRHNQGRDNFYVANAMAASMPVDGWNRERFAAARKYLLDTGHLVLVRPASRHTGAALYKFGKIAG